MTSRKRAADAEFGRREILDAAAQAFMEQGYSATSIDTVADILQCTKGRIYYHFKSKADLFFEVHRTGMLLDHGAMRPLAESDAPPEDKLRDMLTEHIRFIITNLPYSKVVVQGVKMHLDASTTPKQRETLMSIIALHREVEDMFRSVLEQGIASGAFVACDPHLVVKALLGAVNWMTIWYQQRSAQTDADRQHLIREITDYAMRGVEAR